MATIKEMRKFLGITQKELSEQSGINIRLLQKYESGECLVKNMSPEVSASIEQAFGCSLEKIGQINLNIFTDDTRACIKSGDLDISDLFTMSKYREIENLSKIGRFGDTFRANYSRIPEGLFVKLSSEELAALVDAFYKCYSDGKNHS